MERCLKKLVLEAGAMSFQDPEKGGREPAGPSGRKTVPGGLDWRQPVYIRCRREGKKSILVKTSFTAPGCDITLSLVVVQKIGLVMFVSAPVGSVDGGMVKWCYDGSPRHSLRLMNSPKELSSQTICFSNVVALTEMLRPALSATKRLRGRFDVLSCG